MILFSNDGDSICIKANKKSIILVISGEPINESIESFGPSLMNTKTEIVEAINDFNTGQFGE